MRLKSRGIIYVAPDGTAQKTLSVVECAEPLAEILPHNTELAPACNLRDWLLWKIKDMVINDYLVIPHINAIISRNGTRTYTVLHSGNITPIVGQSHDECLVKIFTWLGCVCASENTIDKPQAAFVFQQWCRFFAGDKPKPVGIRVKRREEFLSEMLAYEPSPLCIQMPGLFSDMPLWELLVPQLRYGQFVNVNQICAILARPSRDTYWLLYENKIHEFVREKDDDGQFEQTSEELREELVGKVRLLMKLQAG